MIKTKQQAELIAGKIAIDDRGSVKFVNDFTFTDIKRFYQVENHSPEIIRAWHGHLKEAKYVFVSAGTALVAVVKITDTKQPDRNAEVKRFILSAKQPSILYIPPGFANGFRVYHSHTCIQFFSTSSLEESLNDDYRFSYDYWGTKVWETQFR